MTLDPRSVPPSSWREWLVAGLALSTRRTGTFILFGAACVAGHALLGTIGLGAAMVPLAFGTGCLIAECADKGLTLREALRGRSWRAAWRLALYGFVVAVAFWAVGLFVLSGAVLTGLYDPGASAPIVEGEGVARRLAEALCAAWFLSASVVLFGTSVVVTFLVPLLALAEAPFAEALRTALIATRRNDFVVLVASALAGSAAIGFLTPFLVVPWVAIVSSVMYVAYRDVFLGRSENAPAPLAAKARTSGVGQSAGRRSLGKVSVHVAEHVRDATGPFGPGDHTASPELIVKVAVQGQVSALARGEKIRRGAGDRSDLDTRAAPCRLGPVKQ